MRLERLLSLITVPMCAGILSCAERGPGQPLAPLGPFAAEPAASAALLTASPAPAQCTYGDLRAIFQSLEVFSSVQGARGIDTRKTRRLYAPLGGPCQYRLWAGTELGSEDTPPVQTFAAGQSFLGGSVLFWDYENWGFTRKQAIHDITLFEEHLYLMPTDASWNFDPAQLKNHEQTMMVSSFRNSVGADGVSNVSRHKAIIKQLPAGRYVSVYTWSYPGNPELLALHPSEPDLVSWLSPFEFSSVVRLDIVPAP